MTPYHELDPEQFNFKEGVVAGEECVLITPKDITCKWTHENQHYRSVIVLKSSGEVISRGFSKFVNWGEKPDFQPWDMSWPIDARHKLDGSLLIVSKYKGEFIIRTRGVFDARAHETGNEIDFLM